MKQYLWDKRRAKKHSVGFTSRRGIDGFDFLILAIIFFVGLMYFYITFLGPNIKSVCTAQLASFGQSSTTPPVFNQLFFTNICALVFWGIVIACKRKNLRTKAGVLWNSIIAVCLTLMCLIGFHMSIWDDAPVPDGTLAVATGAWSLKSGKAVWHPRPLIQTPASYGDKTPIYFPHYRRQKCVWLEAGLISADHDIVVNDHEDYFDKKYNPITGNPHYYTYRAKWEPPTFTEYMSRLFSTNSQMQIMRDQEHIRPITDAERIRFMEKEKCLKALKSDPDIAEYLFFPSSSEKCDPTFYPDWPTDW